MHPTIEQVTTNLALRLGVVWSSNDQQGADIGAVRLCVDGDNQGVTLIVSSSPGVMQYSAHFDAATPADVIEAATETAIDEATL